MPVFGSVPDIPITLHKRHSGVSDDIDFEIKGRRDAIC